MKINTPSRVYYLTHETPQELLNWSDVMKNYLKLTSISSINFDDSGADSTTTSNSEWIEYSTDDGIPYWYNTVTQQSVWENPNK